MKRFTRLHEEDASKYLGRMLPLETFDDIQLAISQLQSDPAIGSSNLIPAVRWVASDYETSKDLIQSFNNTIDVVDRIEGNEELRDLSLDEIQHEYPTLEDVEEVLDDDSIASGLKKNQSESFEAWADRVAEVHRTNLQRILPNYQVLDVVTHYNREVQTFVYGAMLGIGVLSTNKTGESFMYFVERSRVPMGYSTCSSWLKRYNLNLAIRDAYRMAMLALKRGVFRRCNISQYRKGTGKIRRAEN